MEFELTDIDALARIGKISIKNKELETPNLFPVIHPFHNLISTEELSDLGVKALFTNAYIIYQNENSRNEALTKGIHNYLDFNGIIATDSGAFQQYMYNKKISINAMEIEDFQEKIGSDISVILDVPIQLEDSYKEAQRKVELTVQRAKDNLIRRKNKNCAWIGPLHGGKYFDLLKKCTIEMNKLDFKIYAIGGIVKAFLDYRFRLTLQILLIVKKYLNPAKPIHMFGLGLPQFFSLAVAFGCDLMDSAAYILFAKKGLYFSLSTGTKRLEELEEFNCSCPVCINNTPKELKSSEKNERIKKLAIHNLYISFLELKTIRQSIREGNIWELVEERIRNHPNLVQAARLLKKNKSFFEKYEKTYKNHGRLFTSLESFNRPIIYRYKSRLYNNYRVPENIEYFVILPELDIKGFNSISIKKWMFEINNTKKISKDNIQFFICSEIFGIIPYELLDTFPLGQFESINSTSYQLSLKFCLKFFEKNSKLYEKGAILIPKQFINQFGELEELYKFHPIKRLKKVLIPIFKSKLLITHDINRIIEFFKE